MISGLWGLLVGLIHPNWQLAIEGGQVWAGLVGYPSHNPNFIYLNHSWTILHQITGIFLMVGISEKMITILISGLLGMISCQALSGIVFIFSESLPFSLLFPVFFYQWEKAMALGANYPIMLWDVPHTYGSLSLSLVILILVCIAFKKNYIAGFLLGILPSVHIAWACSLYIILLLIYVFFFKHRKQFNALLPALTLGGIISIISFVDYQSNKIDFITHDSLNIYLKAFFQWDCHRAAIEISHPAIWINSAACIYSLFCLSNEKDNPKQLIYVLMAVGAFLGGLAAILSHYPENLPFIVYQLMPTRLLNMTTICFIASLSMGLKLKPFRGYMLIVFTLLFEITEFFFNFWTFILWFTFLYSGISVCREIFSNSYKNIRSFCIHHRYMKHIPLFLLIIIHTQFMIKNSPHLYQFYLHSDNVLKTAQKTKGMLLTASDMMLVQARTRCPVLLYGESLDMAIYALASAPEMKKILQDIYGVSLFDPPKSVIHKGGLTRCIDKKLWEKRSLEEWLALKNKYHFTHVLTYANYILNLKCTAKNKHYALYEIRAFQRSTTLREYDDKKK
jgi:hypothetical protein